jgi:hypothetical protein
LAIEGLRAATTTRVTLSGATLDGVMDANRDRVSGRVPHDCLRIELSRPVGPRAGRFR